MGFWFVSCVCICGVIRWCLIINEGLCVRYIFISYLFNYIDWNIK